ncbi:hypothetical protein [Actinokineospora enzanensis]|uniref:hypothetical protein n=1 Tax=Actinokineospora enzanensis TaxID=155975 RepID=UPI000361FFCE|nr:hypothetical protein [Actinokineospora enzanensis]
MSAADDQHPAPLPGEDEPHERLTRIIAEADDLPAGGAKCEALERAVRGADAAGLTDLGVAGRLILVNAYREVRRYDLMLTPFAWLRATEQRHPEAFDDWAVHQFTWMHKWLPTGLLGDPRFSLAQITALVDQLEERYRLYGYSPHPVHDKRRALAHHVGDTAAADAYFSAWRAAEPDEMSDCAACVVDSQVGYFVSRGRHDEAIAVGMPVLEEPSDCAEQPHGVLTSLIQAYLATGQLEEAARAHLIAYRIVRGTPQSRSALHRHLRFCAVTDNAARGVDILRDNLDVLTDAPSPHVLQEFAAASALVLGRVPDRAEHEFAVGERVFDGEALRAHCETIARETAAAFDRRNGTDAVSKRVARTLSLPEIGPVVVAVPTTATPSGPARPSHGPVIPPVEVADPVAAANAVCAAFESGEVLAGARLLAALPSTVDDRLPALLAARTAVWRLRTHGPRSRPRDHVDALLALLEPLADNDAALAHLHTEIADALQVADEPDAAAEHARTALAIAERAGLPARIVAAHLALGKILLTAGDLTAAVEAVNEAERVVREHLPHRLGGVTNARAITLAAAGELNAALAVLAPVLEGTWPELDRVAIWNNQAQLLNTLNQPWPTVAAALDRARALTEGTPGPWHADVLLRYTAAAERAGVIDEHLPLALDAVTAARAHLYPVAVARSCLHLAAGYLASGRALEAAETLEEALRLVPADRLDLARDIQYRLAVACCHIDEHEAATRHFSAVLATTADSEQAFRAHTYYQLGDCHLHDDDNTAAAPAFRASADLWRALDRPIPASEALVRLAQATGLPDLPTGLVCLDEATALVADDSDDALAQRANITSFRAALLAQHGHYPEALAANHDAETLAVRLGDIDGHAFLARRAALIYLDLDDPTTAEAHIRRAAALITDDTDPGIIGGVLGVLARILEEQGKQADTDPVVRALTDRLENED